VSVLGCGLVMSMVVLSSGCSLLPSAPKPKVIEISAKPIEKPKLDLPKADELFFKKIEWVLITPDNYEEVFAKLGESGRPIVLFGLTDEGYGNLAMNLSSLRSYVQQQQIIIAAYEAYYKQSDKALDAANAEIAETADEAKQIKQQNEQRRDINLNPFNQFNK
jgi:hypothetical protein